jgi:thioredoxin 2
MAVVTCPKCGSKNRVDEGLAMSLQPKCGKCGTILPNDGNAGDAGTKPITITDDSLEQILKDAGERPVLVDAWATWCPPCRMLAPTIDALAAESNGRWIIGKLDTDANPQTGSRFGIEAIPTMLIFKRGRLVETLVGLQPKNAIESHLKKHA